MPENSRSVRSKHAVAMDRIYRYQRHFYDISRKYYLFGRDRLIRQLGVPAGGSVLELGCGTGRNLVVAARTYPDARFLGVDISAEMLATARANVMRSGMEDRISAAQGAAEDFDAAYYFETGGFDRVMLPYCLSMIPDWQAAIDNALAQIKADGSVHIVDFGAMEEWPAVLR